MADRPKTRTMVVLGSRRVTPSMLRVTLGGAGMVGFPLDQQGGYVKLMLSAEVGATKPVVRTFTIRKQREGELDIDFALHGHGPMGLATKWALAAAVGEEIALGGPGPAKPSPPGFDHYLIAGDMTALPAISVNLEALPRHALGQAFIEVQTKEDCQQLESPPGVTIRWLVNPRPGSRPDLFEEAVRDASWPAGSIYAWAACEFSAMRRLRTYLREERGLEASALYLSSYWKSGLAEEAHKVLKRDDAMTMDG
jgi:NADPH-dependent ferric siderophore reductase